MIRFKPEQQVYWYDVGRDELRTGKIYKAQIIESWNGDKLGYIVLTQDKCITEQRVTVLESQIGLTPVEAVEAALAVARETKAEVEAEKNNQLRACQMNIDKLEAELRKIKGTAPEQPTYHYDETKRTLYHLMEQVHGGGGNIGFAEIDYRGRRTLFSAHLTKQGNIGYRYWCPGNTACMVKGWPTVYSKSVFWANKAIWTRDIPHEWKVRIQEAQEQGQLL